MIALTNLFNSEIGTIPSIWDNGKIRDTSMEIAWDLNCADESIVKGYNISYCVISINSNLKYCDEPPIYRFVLLGDKMSINKHRLTSLRPYTKYNISVAMISISNRMGPFSKSILVQTIEGSKWKFRTNVLMNHNIVIFNLKLPRRHAI